MSEFRTGDVVWVKGRVASPAIITAGHTPETFWIDLGQGVARQQVSVYQRDMVLAEAPESVLSEVIAKARSLYDQKSNINVNFDAIRIMHGAGMDLANLRRPCPEPLGGMVEGSSEAAIRQRVLAYHQAGLLELAPKIQEALFTLMGEPQLADYARGLGGKQAETEVGPAVLVSAPGEVVEYAPRRNGIPRRAYVQCWTPAEKAIRAAMLTVEEAGAHPLLTEAVVLLQDAFSKVADYVEGPGAVETVERAGWIGRSSDLSKDSGQPWFSYSYEGATESVSATASTPKEAQLRAALKALAHPEYMDPPTEPAERND